MDRYQSIKDFCCEESEEILLADGFEDAFIGIVSGKMREDVACYDYDKCLSILCKRDKMTHEEAEEFFGFNVIDAYVGERTPVFLRRYKP